MRWAGIVSNKLPAETQLGNFFEKSNASFTKIKKMPSQRVYIGNLGSDVRERDVEKFFKGFGKLGEISIKNGYGFVDFDDYRDADDAVHDLDGKDIRGVR